MTKERRQSVRIFLPSNQVRVVTGPYMALVGKVLDISMGGVRFASESPLEGSEFLELEIMLPSGQRLHSECRIVHTERDPHHPARLLYGVQFITLDDGSRALLHDFVASHSAETCPPPEADDPNNTPQGDVR